MLPHDLLIVFKRKGKIKPRYLKDTKIAEELIEIFKEYEGRKYKELQEELEEFEEIYNYKVVRGLSTLLERRCEFESPSLLNGREIRKYLFERGFVLQEEERRRVLAEAGGHFNVSPEEIEEAMFSDLKEEQLIKKFYPLSSLELIKRYNLSLTQTLLFDALELTFKISGNYQEVFRQIKYLGLMYEIEDGNEVKITGPASIFKKTRKYGVAMAKLIPSIMKANTWHIKAKIEQRKEAKIYDFELTCYDGILLPKYSEPIEHFDSEVEEKFYNDFKSLNTGWKIKREPTIIKAGNYVIIPDFGFYKNNMQHYMEVVGFWTPEYLERKIKKLRKAGIPIIIAVNEDLSCKKEDFSGDVIFYKRKIPLKPIINILNKMEEENIQREVDRVAEIKIEEEIASFEEKAREVGISKEALSKIKIPDYFIVGDKIVAKSYLERLRNEIGEEREYEEVEEILKKHGLTMRALDYMGYRIIWEGLKPKKVVYKERGL